MAGRLQKSNGRAARAAIMLLLSSVGVAVAATSDGHYVPPSKSGINKDAMTMQECRDRLAAPPKERPPSDDPEIDIDAMCKNMLGAGTGPKSRRVTAKSASAPGQPASR